MRLRYFALIGGILFLLLGILGFIPGLLSLPASAPILKVSMGYGYLFGIFPVNLVRNLIYLAIGVWGIIAYRRELNARLFARSMAICLGLLAVLGLIPVTKMLFGLVPLFGHNIWFHALIAAIAAYFGWFRKRKAEDIGMGAAA